MLFAACFIVMNTLAQDPSTPSTTPEVTTAPSASLPDDKPTFKERLFTGGNLGLSFGNTTYIDVSPLIGYRISERLSTGLQPTYQFIRQRFCDVNGNNCLKFDYSIYGGSLFARAFITKEIFAHTEYQVLNLEVYDDLVFDSYRTNIPFFYVGGGYRSQLGANAAIVFYLLYDIHQDRLSPFPPLIPRGGIVIGL